MCCSCEENIYTNCACSVFKFHCLSTYCCWCCFLIDWEKQLGDVNPYEILLIEVHTLLKRQRHLKPLKKIFKNLLVEIGECQRRYTKLEQINFSNYLQDMSMTEDSVFDMIEKNLIYKIRYKTNQWQIMVEMCLVLLDLETNYFEITSYKNIQKLAKFINHGIYGLTKLFITITRTEFNISIYNSNKEKILDLETNLSLLEQKLANKIDKI